MTDKTITVTLKLDLDDLAAQFRAAADALTDRHAANEARQRESQMEDAWQSRDWESVRRLQDEARQREAVEHEHEWEYDRTVCPCGDSHGYCACGTVEECRPEPDPLDEGDHRVRVDAEGDLWYRNPGGCWHPGGCLCGDWTLAYLNKRFGPITFPPDASPAPQDAAQGAAEGEGDAVEGGGPAGPPEALLCHECGHDIDLHLRFRLGCLTAAAAGMCPCRRTPSDIARHLTAQATS